MDVHDGGAGLGGIDRELAICSGVTGTAGLRPACLRSR